MEIIFLDMKVETFKKEVNLRLSQEMDSMMSMVHAQINRAISSAISDRVIPEKRNKVSSMSSSGNRDTEASLSLNSQENSEKTTGLKTRITKEGSRSACDLRNTEGLGSYKYSAKKPQVFSTFLEKHLSVPPDQTKIREVNLTLKTHRENLKRTKGVENNFENFQFFTCWVSSIVPKKSWKWYL